ncbi:MAG: ribosome recycling factor [Planctomycetota bacterium]
MDLDEIQLDAEEKMDKTVELLEERLRGIRTGRASAALVEHIRVEYYGTATPLRQLATIGCPEPQLILIRPFDPSSLKAIEKAILASELGITPQNDGKFIRLGIPPLSEERRRQLVASVKEMAEEARVSLRNVRREANKQIEILEKEHKISEDDAFATRDEVQELTKAHETRVAEVLEHKTQEIMTI